MNTLRILAVFLLTALVVSANPVSGHLAFPAHTMVAENVLVGVTDKGAVVSGRYRFRVTPDAPDVWREPPYSVDIQLPVPVPASAKNFEDIEPMVHTELATPFTSADTIGPVSVNYSGDKLTVMFANFGTPTQSVVFHDARVFSWSGWDDAPMAIPDRVYQVAGSAFLAPQLRFSVEGIPFVHFKLGFNAEGRFLDVVATKMEYGTSDN